MGKKKMKTGICEKVEARRNAGKKQVNPFDVKINRQRHNILGNKIKGDKGMPGVSRSKINKKLEEIYRRDQIRSNKSNILLDRRIGEHDNNMSKEDRIVARLVQERRRKQKKNIYNLNDDEVLTHLGKPISDITTFDAPESDSDNEDKLGAEYVKEAHFGGFLTKKVDQNPAKTHKELIDNLISESKQRKHERQVEKEFNMDLTEKLDKEWKEVHQSIMGLKVKKGTVVEKPDDYDMLVHELKFAPRGRPISQLKTPEEIAHEEKKKLEKLEEQRQLRMRESEKKITTHVSADSLDDYYYLESNTKAKGKEKELSTDITNAETSNKMDSDNNGTKSPASESKHMYSDSCDLGSDDENEENGENYLNNNKDFSYPSTFGEFQKLILDCTPEEQSDIVEQIIKCNHPSLREENVEKMQDFFKILLQYVNYICRKEKYIQVIDNLIPHIQNLTELLPLPTAYIFRDMLYETNEQFRKYRNTKNHGLKKKAAGLTLNMLMLLKLCSNLYSTSDYKHPIVIPAMLMMSEILKSKCANTFENLLVRLFVCHLLCEYVSQSNRYVPDAICCLQGILSLACAEDINLSNQGIYFNSKFLKDKLLLITSAITNEPQKISLSLVRCIPKRQVSEIQIGIIYGTIKVLNHFAEMYSNLICFNEIFKVATILCKKLPLENYPSKVVSSIEELQQKLSVVTSKKHLMLQRKKPEPLKLLTPKFDVKFDGRKHHVGSKKVEQSLLRQYKTQYKSTLKEIRKETRFVSQQRHKEQLERDAERKRKVKELYQELAMQEGDFKKLKKKR